MNRESAGLPPVVVAIATMKESGLHSACGLVANAATAGQFKPSSQQIADLARRIWEAEGRPDGRDKIHWLEAEARLNALFGQIRLIRESTSW